MSRVGRGILAIRLNMIAVSIMCGSVSDREGDLVLRRFLYGLLWLLFGDLLIRLLRCHAVGHDRDYPNSHFDMGVFDDDLVAQTCILGGLTVSDTLSISIAYYQRSLIHCMN